MPDINDIRREIDGLHANATPGPWKALHQTSGEFAGIVSGDGSRRKGTRPNIAYMANGSGSPDHIIIAELFNAWPTISAALAEAEEMRRKARAFDAIADQRVFVGRWADHEMGPCWRACPLGGPPGSEFSMDLLTAVEAALAAKEQA